jgi:hypothetical protein
MSTETFSIGPAPGSEKYFENHIEKLFRFDSIRANELAELGQYAMIYAIVSFIVSGSLNLIFRPYDETIKTPWLAFEVFYEIVIIVIVVFYMRKLIKTVPFLFEMHWPGAQKYTPYLSTEFEGEIAISIIFIGMQFRLIKKLDLLSRRLYGAFFGTKLVDGGGV